MKITIGTTNADRRALHKRPSLSGNIEVTVKEGCSVINPVFILKYGTAEAKSNYLYAPDFGRYYFIDDVILLPGGRAEVHCTVDVLETYQTEIENLTINVARNADSGKRNPKISDSAKPLQADTATDTYVFSNNPFSNFEQGSNYILAVLGGGH